MEVVGTMVWRTLGTVSVATVGFDVIDVTWYTLPAAPLHDFSVVGVGACIKKNCSD